MLRLDKFLSENTVYTRSELKGIIKKGRVTVNGETVKIPDMKISQDDTVLVDGKEVNAIGFVYLLMNKPNGVVSATEDRDKTVIDVLKENNEFAELASIKDLVPVGRLDKDTEGLLILSNDGAFVHEVLSPNKHVEKTYYAECEGTLCDNAVTMFEEGIQVGEEYKAKPSKLVILEKNEKGCKLNITLTEGKFHQVKRMCHEVNVEVTYLKRISFGRLQLPSELPVGKVLKVNKSDITG